MSIRWTMNRKPLQTYIEEAWSNGWFDKYYEDPIKNLHLHFSNGLSPSADFLVNYRHTKHIHVFLRLVRPPSP